MRAPVLALFFCGDRDGLMAAARSSARITHAHPLGIEAQFLIALAAHALLQGRPATELIGACWQTQCSTAEISERIKTVKTWIESAEMPGPREVARKLGQWDNGTDIVPDRPLHRALAHEHFLRGNDGIRHCMSRRRGHNRRNGGRPLGHCQRGRASALRFASNPPRWSAHVAARMFQRHNALDRPGPSLS